MSNRTPDHSEKAGFEIGRRMIEAVRADQDNQASVHRVCTAAMVLCSAEESPRKAFVGFASAVAPALREAAATEKALATLAARAALAGHTCTRDSDGRLTLARWGHSKSFDRLEDAEAWLLRVTGKAAL